MNPEKPTTHPPRSPEKIVNLFERALNVPSRICPECGPPKMITINLPSGPRTVPAVCDHLVAKAEAETAERERLNRTAALVSAYGASFSDAWRSEELPMDPKLPGMAKPLMVARFMLDTLDERIANGDGMLFQGTPGNGKSNLSKWIAQEAARRGYFVIWVKIKALCDQLKDWDRRAEVVKALQAADLLVLDELVNASETRWTTDELMGIVDIRHDRRKSTILTTNFKDKQIMAHYFDVLTRGKDGYDKEKAGMLAQRFMSRLQPPKYRRTEFTGPDYRALNHGAWGPEEET